jgi:hypothetical protein
MDDLLKLKLLLFQPLDRFPNKKRNFRKIAPWNDLNSLLKIILSLESIVQSPQAENRRETCPLL